MAAGTVGKAMTYASLTADPDEGPYQPALL